MCQENEHDILIFEIERADLCCPEQATDHVLRIAETKGFDAALQEIHRLMLGDDAEFESLGGSK